jgi:ferrochelatase
MSKTAIVLFNLGGPDTPAAVKPFLFNLFNDPAIIGAPGPVRWALARFISARRAPVAREIYENLGGASPLLANTRTQAEALETALRESPGLGETKVFICMRYWHPMSAETVAEVAEWGPDRVVLLPLYPQFSTTTSGSSIGEWHRAAHAVGLKAETRTVCCYPFDRGFVAEVAARTRVVLDEARKLGDPRVLFSAHGLPKKIVEKGDPYQWQVEQSTEAVVAALDEPELDWLVCYQSRVGPLEWIGPDTEAEIVRAAEEGLPIVVVPIAFVSEHSETLVELDIEYRELAEKHGAAGYLRVPTVDAGTAFIEGLAAVVSNALERGARVSSGEGTRLCPARWGRCPMAADVEDETAR